jgi:uncharacterized protein YneF (UPF0154 family)
MTKQNKPFDNVSRLEKIVVYTAILVSVFGGMFAAIAAINNFKNYDNPYFFGFSFGIIGLIGGLFVAKRLKTRIVINQKMQEVFYVSTIYIAIGFIGLTMLVGQYANNYLATKDKCDSYYVADKIFKKGGSGRHRGVELNILVVNVGGVNHRIITNNSYWQTVSVGQQIGVCIYKSVIGFDYIELTNEN